MEKNYWDKRWQEHDTGWDLGTVSPPLQAYFEQLSQRDLRILIPGCGNAYEAEYLWKNGFHQTYLVELAPTAVASFLKRYPEFPEDHIFIQDFFELRDQFDLIIEQTFFCAIDPKNRERYARHTAELLKPGGKLVGVLFNRDFEGGPPFGGHREEYVTTFSPYFELKICAPCYNSAAPRAGTELFIEFIKI